MISAWMRSSPLWRYLSQVWTGLSQPAVTQRYSIFCNNPPIVWLAGNIYMSLILFPGDHGGVSWVFPAALRQVWQYASNKGGYSWAMSPLLLLPSMVWSLHVHGISLSIELVKSFFYWLVIIACGSCVHSSFHKGFEQYIIVDWWEWGLRLCISLPGTCCTE